MMNELVILQKHHEYNNEYTIIINDWFYNNDPINGLMIVNEQYKCNIKCHYFYNNNTVIGLV